MDQLLFAGNETVTIQIRAVDRSPIQNIAVFTFLQNLRVKSGNCRQGQLHVVLFQPAYRDDRLVEVIVEIFRLRIVERRFDNKFDHRCTPELYRACLKSLQRFGPSMIAFVTHCTRILATNGASQTVIRRGPNMALPLQYRVSETLSTLGGEMPLQRRIGKPNCEVRSPPLF